MRNQLNRLFGWVVVLTFVQSACWAQDAQDRFELAYGHGVHSFFSGQFSEAFDQFTEAIDSGFSDPRPYYFRGLVSETLGRDGKRDMYRGAMVEFRGGGSSRLVNQSLERIQGPHRMLIEKVRSEVRAETVDSGLAGITIIDLGGRPADGVRSGAPGSTTTENSKPLVLPGQEQPPKDQTEKTDEENSEGERSID